MSTLFDEIDREEERQRQERLERLERQRQERLERRRQDRLERLNQRILKAVIDCPPRDERDEREDFEGWDGDYTQSGGESKSNNPFPSDASSIGYDSEEDDRDLEDLAKKLDELSLKLRF